MVEQDPCQQVVDSGIHQTARIDSATQLSLAVAPDATWVALCALGCVWRLDLTREGIARKLTDDSHDARHPVISPDGQTVYFQSFATGFWQIVSIPAEGGLATEVTHGDMDHRDPALDLEGRRLAVAVDIDGRTVIHQVDVVDGRPASPAIRKCGPEREENLTHPCFGPRGEFLVRVGTTRLDRLTTEGEWDTILEVRATDIIYGAAVSPTGRVAAVIGRGLDKMPVPTVERVDLLIDGENCPQLESTDVLPCTPVWTKDDGASWELFLAADGKVRRVTEAGTTTHDLRIPVTIPTLATTGARPLPGSRADQPRGIVDLQVTSDGLIFRAAGRTWCTTVDGQVRPIHQADGVWRAGLTALDDGAVLQYESDRSGRLNIWRHDLRSGAEIQVTDRDDAPHAAATSPDGRRTAWIDLNDRVWCLDHDTGQEWCLSSSLTSPGAISWHPNGRVFALASVAHRSARGGHGAVALSVITPFGAGEPVNHHLPAPAPSLSGCHGCGPVFSPTGDVVAVVIEGLLHLLPVEEEPAGDITFGPARQLSDVAVDWPTFSPDGKWVYGLQHGHVCRFRVDGTATELVPLRFPTPTTAAPVRRALRVARLWDGERDAYRGPVDIVLRGERIEAILPAGCYDGPELVDVGDLTAIPGFIDAHVHVTHGRARALGRFQGLQWLAYGVTGLRSMGGDLYFAWEHRESSQSGARLAPRLFICGELLDGPRVAGDNRVIRSRAALDREIDKHLSVGVDVAKAYVRLPPLEHQHLIRRFRAAGVPTAGHYLYPNVSFNQGSVEHFGSPSRLDLNALVSPTGRSYSDVRTVLESGSIAVCPTLFNSRGLAAADTWRTDERTEALVPAWQQEHFDQRLGQPAVTETSMRGLARHAETMVQVIRAGGTVLSGTDMPHELPGLSLHLNMQTLVREGATPAEAMRTGSVNVANWLGVGAELGTLQCGKAADIALVAGDPLKDIEDAMNTRYVVTAGHILSRGDLISAGAPTPAPLPTGRI